MRLSTLDLLSAFVYVLFLNSCWITPGETRGRAGGRFGGARSSRSAYGSRSTYSTSRSRFGGVRYKTAAVALAAGAVVYGMSRYQSRYHYGSRYYREDPNLCTNLDRYATYDNGTLSRTQKLTWFVCPYESNDAENAIYCCGPNNKQYCCSYWQSPSKVAGVVVGVLVAIIVISVVVCCLCKRRRTGKQRDPPVGFNSSTSATYHAAPTAPPSVPVMAAPSAPPAAPYGQPTGYGAPESYPPSSYPSAPTQPGSGIGFESMGGPPPPSYSSVMK